MNLRARKEKNKTKKNVYDPRLKFYEIIEKKKNKNKKGKPKQT